jgi:hypothetical protein
LVSGVFTMHHVSTQFFFTFSKAIPWRTWNWAAAAAIPRWVTWLAAWSPSGAGPQDVKLRDKRMHQPDLVHSIVIVYICYNYMYVYIYTYNTYLYLYIYICNYIYIVEHILYITILHHIYLFHIFRTHTHICIYI